MLRETKASLILLFVWVTTTPVWSSQDLCPYWERTDIVDAFFHKNGSVEDQEASLEYPPHTYWAKMENGIASLHGCPCSLGHPCIRKCCEKNQAMDNDTLDCFDYKGESRHWFRPNVSASPMYEMRQAEYGHFGLVYGNFCFGFLLEPNFYQVDEFYINFTDGKLTIPKHKKHELDTSQYCLEYFPAIDLYLPYVCFHKIENMHGEEICDTLRYTIYPLGMVISIVFLLISLVIYATTAELRNLHGKCLMCHIVSLLVAYLFLAIVQGKGSLLGDNTCTAFGFVIYFALLCSFFWLNIMCIDIYIAFSSFIPPRLHSSEFKKFLSYVVYAWGLPLLIISITAIMEFHPGISNYYMKPEFKATCWFYSKPSRLAYFIAPVGVLVICNVVLFVLTAFNIYKVERETSILQRGTSSRSREDKNRMKLYIKLSIVMGVSWVLEIVSYVAGGSKCIWLFTDTVNTLQGLFIFLIFVCKRNVKEIMKKRLRRLLKKFTKSPPSVSEDQEEDREEQSSSSRSQATASTNAPSVELKSKSSSQEN